MHSDRWLRRTTLAAAALLVAAAPAAAVKRRAFVTSVTGTGNLASWPDAGGQTGVGAGNAICRARATAAGLPNANTYRAWLSTPTTDAYCHVKGLTGTKAGGCTGGPPLAAGPWYLVNGTSTFTPALDELTGPQGVIYRPVIFDEFGDQIPDTFSGYTWTGTDSFGAAYVSTCNGWTSASAVDSGGHGTALGSAQLWSHYTGQSCSNVNRLLCLEPGPSDTTVQPWGPAALVFTTSKQGLGDLGSWPEAGGATGLEAGDAICRNLAAAAHLPAPDSFVAWLSDSTVDAADRITLSNVPFRRIDGYAIALDKIDLLAGSIGNSLHVREDGTYRTFPANGYAWTGTAPDGTAVPGSTCLDWVSSSGASSGLSGHDSLARTGDWTQRSLNSCNYQFRLYCFSNVVTLFWDGFEYTGDSSRWSAVVP